MSLPTFPVRNFGQTQKISNFNGKILFSQKIPNFVYHSIENQILHIFPKIHVIKMILLKNIAKKRNYTKNRKLSKIRFFAIIFEKIVKNF